MRKEEESQRPISGSMDSVGQPAVNKATSKTINYPGLSNTPPGDDKDYDTG
jgi:hypothetical protein